MGGFEYDIGFLGGGQLARMSIQAAQRMGLRCLSIDPSKATPASQIADALVGPLDQLTVLPEVFLKCARVTLENEFIPAGAIEQSQIIAGREDGVGVLPTWVALMHIQDKYAQKLMMKSSGVPSPEAWDTFDLTESPSFPVILKSRFGGYDGKGTRTVRTAEEFDSFRTLMEAWEWYAEQFVPFKRELAVMVYRSETEVGTFPTMETIQTDHVCDLVFPAGVDASEIAIQAVEAVHGYGLFGVELFELEDGSFQVNEIAPRPHNTGHYTLDWGGVSQFEQHVRLVMGWPCEKPEGQETCMANLLGQPGAGDYKAGIRHALEAVPEAHVHWYGKAESRPGRKMGHINVVGSDCVERAKLAREHFYAGWTS
ncbi:MAG: ATP-grasp domain-containing protein [Armatimonadetes bacterium]|nr:ATP-grasp domain-containing protein [Armatimonadota bacterium]